MPIQWLTTMPNPRVVSHTADDGQRGWRTHAVEAEGTDSLASLRHKAALCGLRPAHGWGLDLFIERKCTRCLRKAGMACHACNGTGATGSLRDGTWKTCDRCATTGEKST
jgi:hypothetical protein